MKTIKFCMIAAVVVLTTACNKDKDDQNPMTMTMTTQGWARVSIRIAGAGTMTINWGDETEIETYSLWDLYERQEFTHYYEDHNTWTHTIEITGENITRLVCSNIGLSHLDVGRNKMLEYLNCGQNSLTYLDVSKNTKLSELWCYMNQLKSLDVSALTELTDLYCFVNHGF